MNQSESSSSARGRGKNKRIWTYYEDEDEGGFKNGYCSVLKNALTTKLPGSGLTAIPHIESRVRHFRTKYGAIEVMLAKSGFNWDDNRKMVQCEKQQYDAHCKDNPDAKGLYGIAFPHFDTLAAIYGKDIATGEGAKGLGESVSNMEKEIVLGEECQLVEEDRMSMDTPRRSLDRRKIKDTSRENEVNMSSDPFFDLARGIRGDLNKALHHFGRMAEAMEKEAKAQEEATQKDQMQVLQENSIAELTRLGVFVRVPNQMTMLFALSETLMREFIENMIAGKFTLFLPALP
ncbi:hypothetical protein PAHAL_5G340900 [Panicum hallii]|uniref:Uncharacterized protein n=1 Tax=Panicum hallii TaxID=206008 RepID=A0A2T8IM38_9POAL|nr:hypothetical protein PAHAL_5G340900 [Panicum hallii]